MSAILALRRSPSVFTSYTSLFNVYKPSMARHIARRARYHGALLRASESSLTSDCFKNQNRTLHTSPPSAQPVSGRSRQKAPTPRRQNASANLKYLIKFLSQSQLSSQSSSSSPSSSSLSSRNQPSTSTPPSNPHHRPPTQIPSSPFSTSSKKSNFTDFFPVTPYPPPPNHPYQHTPRPYTFHIGASWAGKPDDPAQRAKVPFPSDTLIGAWRDKMLLCRASDRRLTGKRSMAAGKDDGKGVIDAGEDFFFVQEMRNRSGVSFGVADGVGGWVDSGYDPALFSQALMYHAHRYSRNAWAGEPEIDPMMDYEEREQVEGWEMTPYECLDLAYGGVLREKYVQAGSSTACIISLNAASGLLRAANLGDSGFSVVRSTSIIHHQPSQTHFFNCPKQLTKLPANAGRKFSRACVDSPHEADTFEVKLRDGDVVVAYTDGFSDNVFPAEMVTICSLVARAGGSEDEQVQAMADRMVEYARQCMKSKNRVSPFERDAARHGMYFRGGKPDDVTVVVAMVRETS